METSSGGTNRLLGAWSGSRLGSVGARIKIPFIHSQSLHSTQDFGTGSVAVDKERNGAGGGKLQPIEKEKV